MSEESDIMATSDNYYFKQLHTFIKYCQKHPIDMRIINELDKPVINILRNTVSIRKGYNTNNIYMMLEIYQHVYMFRFKDNASLSKFILVNKSYNFDYNEGYTTLNRHDLRYITFPSYVYKTKNVYTFDENTKYVLIRNEINNHVYLRNDIHKFVDVNYNDKLAVNGWTHFDFKNLPDKINQFVTAQQVFATVSSKL